MYKLLMALAVLFGAATISAPAFAEEGAAANEPAKLTDAQLDEVTAGHEHGLPAFVLAAGHGPPFLRHGPSDPSSLPGNQPTTQVNFIIRDVTLTFNIGPNSPVNFAAVLQLSLLSQAAQTGSATALLTGH